ncbi:MAG TPA: hypothetical protein VLT16_09810 [Candidatus Limnocylindrales bacterium]|nr:hypothetical protein [Candidatus Limnocylindrales bacterium]
MRLWIKALITLALVTAAGYVADRLLRQEGVPGHDLLLLSDFLVGLVAASLVAVLGLHQEQRARFVAGRLRVIAEMNHHIRNALQVIAYHSSSGRNEREIVESQEAVNRISWALREVLPQLPDSYRHEEQRNEAAVKNRTSSNRQ